MPFKYVWFLSFNYSVVTSHWNTLFLTLFDLKTWNLWRVIKLTKPPTIQGSLYTRFILLGSQIAYETNLIKLNAHIYATIQNLGLLSVPLQTFRWRIRPWQNNCLVPVTRPTLAQNALNRRLSIFLRAPARNWNHGDEIVESWWQNFPNGDTWYTLGMHGFHLGYRKLITRICPNYQNAPFHS